MQGFRLSPQQRRIWSLQPPASAWTAHCDVRLGGELDGERLARAVAWAVARHEILRTAFKRLPGIKTPVQVIAERSDFGWRSADLSVSDLREETLAGLLAEEAGRPIDLETEPPLRALLVRLAPEEHLLRLRLPALCADDRSLANLVAEIADGYDGAGESGEVVQYLQFSEWHNEELAAGEESLGARYWRDRTAPLGAAAGNRSVEGSQGAVWTFPEAAREAITAALAKSGEGPDLLLACWQILLFRRAGSAALALVCEGRKYEDLDGALGPFARAVPFFCDLSPGTTVAALVRQTGERRAEAAEWQEHYGENGVPPDFGFRSAVWPAERQAGRTRFAVVDSQAPVDGATLELVCFRQEGEPLLRFHYDPRRFSFDDLDRWAAGLAAVVRSAHADRAARVVDLDVLGEQERYEIVVAFNATRRDWGAAAPVHHLFARQAGRAPDAVALGCGEERLTYAELAARARALARRLRDLGVGPDVRVGLYGRRSLETAIGLLAIWQAGGAFVPLDPSYPGERLAFMARDAGLAALLAGPDLPVPDEFAGPVLPLASRTAGSGGERESGEEDEPVDPECLAYVLYTSGSTGRPKGVAIPHRGLTNYLLWAAERYPVAESRGAPVHSPLGFDLTMTSLLTPLLVGAMADLLPERAGVGALSSALASGRDFGLVKLTPSHLDAVNDALAVAGVAGIAGRTRSLVVGGEPLQASSLAPWRRESPSTRIFNEYGPTETVVGCAVYEVSPGSAGSGPVPIGRPIANTRIYLLDRTLRPVPLGMEGQICVAGAGLARGYLGRPDLTAERFLPDPFCGEPGGRLYATGDLGCLIAADLLEFRGRLDGQIKLRGFRVEPGEVEAVLREHPEVREAAVVPREDPPGNLYLTAYVVGVDGARPPADEVFRFLRRRLPEFMVPGALVCLDSLPLTANGKVDRGALPLPAAADLGAPASPHTLTEELLAEIWGKVLGLREVRRDADFLALGGHSLTAMQVLARIRRVFGVEIAVETFLKAPRLAALAASIDVSLSSGATLDVPPIEPLPRGGEAPLSFSQERLWFLAQLEPGLTAYNLPSAFHLEGELDPAALAASLGEIVRRHEILRTTFGDVDGRAVQRIGVDTPPALPLIDLSGLSPSARAAASARLSREEAGRPFDLARGPIVRAALLRLAPGEHLALCSLHHIASDGWSVGILIRELAELYGAARVGRLPRLPGLPVQYADFALWQRRWLTGESLEAQLAFWREQLGGSAVSPELPGDRPRPAVRGSRGATVPLHLDAEMARAIREIGREAGATPFVVLLAAFHLLLCRHSGHAESRIGVPTAGRNRLEIESLIGCFVNTLVLRLAADPRISFSGLLAAVRQTVLAAHGHQDLPFERLVEELHPERDLQRTPLFQVMFAFDNNSAEALQLPGLTLRALPLHSGAAKFDLTLILHETAGGIDGFFEYDPDLFDATTILRLGEHLRVLLAAALADPAARLRDLPRLAPPGEQQVFREWNDTARLWRSRLPVHRQFEEQAARAPGRVAIASGEETWSYAELDQRSGRLACFLHRQGVGPEARVGLLLERSADLVAAVLAVLKAGGAYVPLDPAQPRERLDLMVTDSAPALVLTGEGIDAPPGFPAIPIARALEERGEEGGAASVDVEVGPERLAYVIYTSGSTGRPKGTMVTHGGLANYLLWAVEVYEPAAGAGAPLHSSLAFDLSITSLFAPLLAGGTVALVPEADGVEPLLAALSGRPGWSLAKLTPAHLRALAGLASAGELAAAARRVIVGGEALSGEDLAAFWRAAPDIPAINEYGPTEAVVGCSVETVSAETVLPGPVPIGRPIANARLHATDSALLPVPVGSVGELLIGGAGLARGYLGRPDLTAERFVPDPFTAGRGERLYRTGDRARFRADGRLEFRGRLDEQVKIRGFRVEPAEVESVLAGHPGIRQVAVVAREEAGIGVRLLAYVAPRAGEAPSAAALRAYLQPKLPPYMIPQTFVLLPELPLAASGKVDRRALPVPERERPAAGFVAPRDRIERQLAAIWEEVLRLDRVGVHDNFFEIGGDSILSIQIVARARREGLRITPRQIFQHQTVAALAPVVDSAPLATAEQGEVAGEAPLTPIQRWFFDQNLPEPHHFNQALLLECGEALAPVHLAAALESLAVHHDALRLRFARLPSGWRQVHGALKGAASLSVIDGSRLPAPRHSAAIEAIGATLQGSLDLAAGPLLRAAYLDFGAARRPLLLLVLHHLVVDGVSWRILLGDLEEAYRRLARGAPVELPAKTTSFKSWAEHLAAHTRSAALAAEERLWREILAGTPTPLPRDGTGGPNRVGTSAAVSVGLEAEETQSLLAAVPRVYGTRPDEVLLTALGLTLAEWSGSHRVRLDLEGHGREEIFDGVDLSRTVGWLTTFHPVLLDLEGIEEPGEALRAVKEQVRQVPAGGIGYGVLRYLTGGDRAGWESGAEVIFNYLGRLDASLSPSSPFRPAGGPVGPSRSPRQLRPYALEINGRVEDGRLEMTWIYSPNLHARPTVERVAASFLQALRELIAHCLSPGAGRYTPSDFNRVRLTQERLDKIVAELDLG